MIVLLDIAIESEEEMSHEILTLKGVYVFQNASINKNARANYLWCQIYHHKQFNYNVWFPMKFETNFHSEITLSAKQSTAGGTQTLD